MLLQHNYNYKMLTFLKPTVGRNMSKRVRKALLINNSHGATFVIVWGVVLYVRRKFASLCCKDAPSLAVFFIDCLKVCTMHLARPFEAGWYG